MYSPGALNFAVVDVFPSFGSTVGLAFSNVTEPGPVAPRHEIRRLPGIGSTGLNLIVGADGDLQSLLLISIEVADQKTVCAVRILEPALVRTGHALADIVDWFDGQLLGKKERN